MPFVKGQSGNPRGRAPGQSPARVVLFDLKQAARKYCPEAIEFIAKHMHSDDERVALAAAIAMIERGYGKPEQKSDATMTHKFAIVPQTMAKDEWLANRGQPGAGSCQSPLALPPPDPDRKLN
jgi:hypothetical protein